MMVMMVWRNLHVHLRRERKAQPAIVVVVVAIITQGLHLLSHLQEEILGKFLLTQGSNSIIRKQII